MDDSVPVEQRRERTARLRSLGAKLHRAFQEQHLGTVRPVLLEYGDHGEGDTTGPLFGYTDNYLRVALPYRAGLANTVQPVLLESIDTDGHLTGTLAETALPSRSSRQHSLTT
jgi:threonylcarbamoyladenosine tRNA methylthiotransferase MtaB